MKNASINTSKILISLFLYIFFSSNLISSDSTHVKTIQKKVDDIDKLVSTYKEIKYKNTCGVIDGSLKMYDANNKIVKVSDNGIGDGHLAASKWSHTFYYENEELIFSKKSLTYYNDRTEKTRTDETLEYFIANQLIIQIINGKTISLKKKESINANDYRYQLLLIKTKEELNRLNCPPERK